MEWPVFVDGLIVVLLSLALGSFATALSWRIPQGISWIWSAEKSDKNEKAGGGQARSSCPQCGHKLAACDLVPLLSWLYRRGRCRYCHAPISWRYPATELAALIAGLAIYGAWGFSVPALIVLAALPFFLALFIIDCEYLILPDQLVVVTGTLGLVMALYQGIALDGGWGGARALALAGLTGAGYAAFVWGLGKILTVVLKKEALGFGDVKFFAVAGIWLGLWGLPLFLITAGLAGVGFGVVWRLAGRGAVFPFGPALIIALFLSLLWQGHPGIF